MGKKISSYSDSDGNKGYHFHCEGCGSAHGVFVHQASIVKDKKGDIIKGRKVPVWAFNGNEERPTFTPSIKVRWVSLPDAIEKDSNGKHILGNDGRIKGAKDEICHSFVTDGKIRYLNDCTHHLKGKTVELVDF